MQNREIAILQYGPVRYCTIILSYVLHIPRDLRIRLYQISEQEQKLEWAIGIISNLITTWVRSA